MSVTPSVVRFLRAYESLSEVCLDFPWGTVARNAAFPHVYDANRAWVFDAPDPTCDDLREAMAIAQGRLPVAYTQVEVLDLDGRVQLVSELTAWLGSPTDVFSFMTTASGPAVAAVPEGLVVSEQPMPDHARWLALIDAGHDDEEPLPAHVLGELALRDTQVFAAAGTRFFVAERDGEVIAYASLLSLHNVGLIDHVATVPTHRRQGAGTAVVAAVIAASSSAGNAATILYTGEGSDAQSVYERLGMRVVARAAQFRGPPP